MTSRGRGIYIIGKRCVTHSRLFLVQTVSYFVLLVFLCLYIVKMQDPSNIDDPPPSIEVSVRTPVESLLLSFNY